MSWTGFFDWRDLFINQIAGNEIVFIFLSFIILAILCAKFRFPNIVTMFVFIAYALIMSSQLPILLAITLLIVGILTSFGLSRIISPR